MSARPLAESVRLGAALLLAACGSTAAEEAGTVTVDFPSVPAAVAADSVEIQVHDGSDPNACLDLVEKRRTGQPLPKPLLDSPTAPPCALAATHVSPLEVGYGKRAFLAVAQRAGQDFLVGCTIAGVGDAKAAVVVPLTPVSNTVAVPATSCVALSAHCNNSCK